MSMTMSMTRRIAGVFLFYKATWLISVRGIALETDDYYYSHLTQDPLLPEGVGFRNDPNILKLEDQTAFDIYTKFKAEKDCPSLRKFITSYANDATEWTADDEKNPERRDVLTLTDANQDIESVRAGLKNALTSQKCIDLFHLVTCDFGGIRQISPFEFVFKTGKWNAEDKSFKGSVNMTSPAAKAYMKTKFGANENNWGIKAEAAMMFADGKGRVGTPPPPASCGYEGGISKEVIPELEDFFNYSYHTENNARFVTTQQCTKFKIFKNGTTDPKCGEKVQNGSAEMDFCAVMKSACKFAYDRSKDRNKKWIQKHPHCPAKTFLIRDANKNQSKQMEKCKLPYVGGVSGSILEQLAFFVDRSGANELDDKLVLVLMAVLNLSGHHSLGEAFATTKPFLDNLKTFNEPAAATIQDIVSVPIELEGGCTKKTSEKKFLTELTAFAAKVFQ